MNVLRRIALGILSSLFITLLFVMAFDVGFVHTATHPTTVKKLIAESGIYDSVVPSVLDQTKQISTGLGDISTTDPAIKNAATSAISPQFVKNNTEAAIDSVYKWLDGAIATPNFKIDLSSVKSSFAANVATNLQLRLAALPVCTPPQAASFNALNATCLPKGVTPAAAAEQVKSSIESGQGFLDQTTLDASNIKNGNSNQPVFDGKLKNVPKQYQRAKKTPAILIALTILVAAGIVFTSRTWQRGLKHVGITMAVIGIVMLVFSWFLNRAVTNTLAPKIKIDNAALQADVRSLVTDVAQQIDKNYWFFGGLYTVVGAGAIAGAEIHRRRQPQTAAKYISTAEAAPAKPHAGED